MLILVLALIQEAYDDDILILVEPKEEALDHVNSIVYQLEHLGFVQKSTGGYPGYVFEK